MSHTTNALARVDALLVGWLRFTRFVSFRFVSYRSNTTTRVLLESAAFVRSLRFRRASPRLCFILSDGTSLRNHTATTRKNKKPNPQTEVVSFRLDAIRSTCPWCVRVPHRPCGVGIRPTGFRSVPFVCCSCFPFRPRWRLRCWLLIIGVDSKFDSILNSTRLDSSFVSLFLRVQYWYRCLTAATAALSGSSPLVVVSLSLSPRQTPRSFRWSVAPEPGRKTDRRHPRGSRPGRRPTTRPSTQRGSIPGALPWRARSRVPPPRRRPVVSGTAPTTPGGKPPPAPPGACGGSTGPPPATTRPLFFPFFFFPPIASVVAVPAALLHL